MKSTKLQLERNKEHEFRQDFIEGLACALVAEYGVNLAKNMTTKLMRLVDSRYTKKRLELEQRQKYGKRFTNCYARSLIAARTGLKGSQIPQALGELKKIQLRIKRLLKELKGDCNGQCSKTEKRANKCISRVKKRRT